MKQRYFLIFATSFVSFINYSMDKEIITVSEVLVSPEACSIITYLKHSLDNRKPLNITRTSIEENTTMFPTTRSTGLKNIITTQTAIMKKNSNSIQFLITIKREKKQVGRLADEESDENSDDEKSRAKRELFKQKRLLEKRGAFV